MANKKDERSTRSSFNSGDRRNGNNRRGHAGKFKDSNAKGNRRNASKRGSTDSAMADAKRSADGQLSSLNDMSWYDKNPLLVQAAASIPFPYRPGMSLPLGNSKYDGTGDKLSYKIPGILTLNYDLSIGRSDSVTSPASLAAKEMYAKVRQAFSGSLPEDAPDILIYMMCMDSIFNQLAEMKRVYRIINAYTPFNYQLPEELLKALLGTNSDTVINNLRRDKVLFFQRINELVGMSRKFTVPNVMDIITRHYWMGENVYSDYATITSQFYTFRNRYHYMFALDKTNSVGALKPVKFTISENDPVGSWYDHVRLMIEALANSEDAYTINGHLIRAYEGSQPFMVDYLTQDETFNPVFVPEVLTQIENINTTPALTNEESLWVTQDPKTNALIHQPTCTQTGDYINGMLRPIINIRSDLPNVVDNVIATRLAAVCKLSANQPDPGVEYQFDIYAGTEIPISFSMRGTDIMPNDQSTYLYINTDSRQLELPSDVNFLLLMSAFDWHPMIKVAVLRNSKVIGYYYGDVHNITTVDEDVLVNLHKVCVLSEFNAYSMV